MEGVRWFGPGYASFIMELDDRDLRAFLVYAARERSLDASLRIARVTRSVEHRQSIDLLRELNRRILFRETRRDISL
jgi:hypothetical protein